MGIFPLTSARWPRTPFAVLAAVVLATAACVPQSGQAPSPAPVVGLAPSPVGAPQPSGSVRVSIDQNSSEARYRAREVLSAFGFTTEAVGATQAVSGSIVLDSTGRVLPEESMVVVDLRGLSSDEGLRDRFIRDFTLQTAQFPTAEFVVREVRGLPWPPPPSGDVSFQLLGDLTVHGVTRPVAWDGTARLNGEEIASTASTLVNITDFGMTLPRVPLVRSLEDALILELEVRGTRSDLG